MPMVKLSLKLQQEIIYLFFKLLCYVTIQNDILYYY